MKGEDTRGRLWFAEDDVYDLDRCETEWSASLTRCLDFLDAASDGEMDRVVEYTSTEGPSHQSTVKAITFQVILRPTTMRRSPGSSESRVIRLLPPTIFSSPVAKYNRLCIVLHSGH
ncbi:MAG TPA: hypothetical protein VKP65_18075 [Rhodothermales bacterium]|nr:hypothetical protein [Rhodothermales bacterium]